ncbi:hypothetical protein EJ357_02450 [Streptomyces cyaneochromogenes]|uniref:Peptidase S8/S53 domain-containing protein n=1 Tax=Streptomyces cyaneochromogenes TaxID=2496836 RepID=A0A3S9LZS0_9ACTN|nr:S8 family serine peptidase [Streptomyces cyaneochromogenes]AZQ32442.1 hypothetical protein EJ357_02450 [Streptomyces cyaneochromogenes]
MGSGARSGGKYRGAAPGAKLIVGKVLDDSGSGSDSAIIAGMQWAVAHGAKVVAMSLCSSFSFRLLLSAPNTPPSAAF